MSLIEWNEAKKKYNKLFYLINLIDNIKKRNNLYVLYKNKK